MAILWAGSRLLWAWLEWPSTWPLVRGLKAVLRYLLFDAEAERQAAVTRSDPPEAFR